jgi:hypothetical protein
VIEPGTERRIPRRSVCKIDTRSRTRALVADPVNENGLRIKSFVLGDVVVA